ncbi:YbjN domain-containing protein [Salinispira pacifica]|uniref:Molecular chaperone Tir n=1 Tax=Salinispira pacifica TaxID=1307761 RepID=V5WD90_9SPIO|nr:hypothetical protein [Salinispira pacifica]AHC13509.1 hypothetical protein L21SP2_0063 [Salinispira pacifica]
MNVERIERYLLALAVTYEKVSEDVWIINDPDKGLNQIVLFVDESLLTVRTKVMNYPVTDDKKSLRLFRELLQLNRDLVHGAYAIEDDYIILMDTLELETMDREELQASLDAIGLGLAEHYDRLKQFLPGHEQEA